MVFNTKQTLSASKAMCSQGMHGDPSQSHFLWHPNHITNNFVPHSWTEQAQKVESQLHLIYILRLLKVTSYETHCEY